MLIYCLWNWCAFGQEQKSLRKSLFVGCNQATECGFYASSLLLAGCIKTISIWFWMNPTISRHFYRLRLPKKRTLQRLYQSFWQSLAKPQKLMTWSLNRPPINNTHSQTGRFVCTRIKFYQSWSILQSISEHVTWKIKQYFISFAKQTTELLCSPGHAEQRGFADHKGEILTFCQHKDCHKPRKRSGTAKFPISRSTQREAE